MPNNRIMDSSLQTNLECPKHKHDIEYLCFSNQCDQNLHCIDCLWKHPNQPFGTVISFQKLDKNQLKRSKENPSTRIPSLIVPNECTLEFQSEKVEKFAEYDSSFMDIIERNNEDIYKLFNALMMESQSILEIPKSKIDESVKQLNEIEENLIKENPPSLISFANYMERRKALIQNIEKFNGNIENIKKQIQIDNSMINEFLNEYMQMSSNVESALDRFVNHIKQRLQENKIIRDHFTDNVNNGRSSNSKSEIIDFNRESIKPSNLTFQSESSSLDDSNIRISRSDLIPINDMKDSSGHTYPSFAYCNISNLFFQAIFKMNSKNGHSIELHIKDLSTWKPFQKFLKEDWPIISFDLILTYSYSSKTVFITSADFQCNFISTYSLDSASNEFKFKKRFYLENNGIIEMKAIEGRNYLLCLYIDKPPLLAKQPDFFECIQISNCPISSCSLIITPNGVLLGGRDQVLLFRLQEKDLEKLNVLGTVFSMDFNEGKSLLALGTYDYILLYSFNGKHLKDSVIINNFKINSQVSCLRFIKDSIIFTISQNNIYIIEEDARRPRRRTIKHSNACSYFLYSKKLNQLIIKDNGRKIYFIKVNK